MKDAPGTTDTDDWLSRLAPEPRAALEKKIVKARIVQNLEIADERAAAKKKQVAAKKKR